MREKRYLLNIESMLESGGDALLREAFDRMDRERRQKVLSLKNVRARAAGTGAGLLIQKALADHMVYCRTEFGSAVEEECLAGQRTELGIGQPKQPALERFSAEELLSVLGRNVMEVCYRYGKNGKPYLVNAPLQFNISHSGNYVFCGVSNQEIGVDIQKIQGEHVLRLAKRFFAEPECRALEACRDEELRRKMFFRMWVRKEAYGKLIGDGIAGAVGKCLWEDVSAGEECPAYAAGKGLRCAGDLIWEEYDEPGGYRMAVCRFRQEISMKTE